jgi:anthranilate synthase component 2
MKILMLDNYDSFTYNLVQLVEENSNFSIDVFRNNEIEVSYISDYDKIILSPGPGLPLNSGILCSLISTYYKEKSIFGVCLGMQAIAEVLGGDLYNLAEPLHGVSTIIKHTSNSLLKGIPHQFKVGRYHSWAVDKKGLPSDLKVTAVDEYGVIMALEHSKYNISGVQFHPESILTDFGKEIIINFLHT